MSKPNIALIDSQNLYLATTKARNPWKVDMKRFRVYLHDKYQVEEAYLFIGAYEQKHSDMYLRFQKDGYIIVYREHGANLKGKKKGNVDVDVVFQAMRDVHERDDFKGIVLVSGDGDYKRMVDWMIAEDRFKKLLLPSVENASSLYKDIPEQFKAFMDSPAMRLKLGMGA